MKKKDGFCGERALVLPQFVVHEMEKDPITSLLHITDIGYYPKAAYHFREREIPISQYVFIYCTEGAGSFSLGGHTYTVGPDQYFILPAGQPHTYQADERSPWTIYWIHFKGKMAQYFAQPCGCPVDIKPSLHSRISDRIAMFEEIFRTLDMGYSRGNLQYACSILYHYFGTLLYCGQYRNAVRHDDDMGDIVAATIHFMKENVEKKMTVGEIAAHVGYSSSHFSRLFSQRTGYSPLAYFNQLKIRQACSLLDFTNMRINQVCYKIGIEDNYYFSRLFTKIMGMSPTQYKRMRKG